MRLRDWGAFALLGCIWGSSFLWIKIAVRELDPFTLVGWRLLFGLVGLIVVVSLRRPAFPRDRRTWIYLAILGITNTALPFVLISWGEKTIDSAVASILNSTVPLFTLVIAHLFLHDDRISMPKVAGLLTGFAGVVLLLLRDVEPGAMSGSVFGQLAVILGAVAYAGSSVFARRTMRGVDSMVQAFVPMMAADASVWAVATQAGTPGRLPAIPLTWVALLWLGLLGSCTAYLLFYRLLHVMGATRTTMVTYVFPVVGVALGILFLGEHADWHLLVGALLVISGIGVVNWPARPALAVTPAAD